MNQVHVGKQTASSLLTQKHSIRRQQSPAPEHPRTAPLPVSPRSSQFQPQHIAVVSIPGQAPTVTTVNIRVY